MVDGRYLWDFPERLLLSHCSSLNKPMNAYVNWVNLIFIIKYCVTSRKPRRMMYEIYAVCTLLCTVFQHMTFSMRLFDHHFNMHKWQNDHKDKGINAIKTYLICVSTSTSKQGRKEGYCCEHASQVVRHISARKTPMVNFVELLFSLSPWRCSYSTSLLNYTPFISCYQF